MGLALEVEQITLVSTPFEYDIKFNHAMHFSGRYNLDPVLYKADDATEHFL